jgi:hypothetical protein
LIVGYASTETPGVDVPYVRLRGPWLQDAGFVIGGYVNIEVSEGRLLIEQAIDGITSSASDLLDHDQTARRIFAEAERRRRAIQLAGG